MRLPSLIAATLLAGAAAAGAGGEPSIRWDFQWNRVQAPPPGFSFARTGRGHAGRWLVVPDPTAPSGDRVLAQLDADDTDDRFPVAVANATVLRDVRVTVQCRPVSGKADAACGLVVRFRDAENYYVARANAAEDNVNLYRVVNGRRRLIAGWRGKVTRDAWHALAIEARGDHLQVSWEGEPVIDVHDQTFLRAGKIGVWTKSDSVTHFAALTATPLD